MAKLPSQLRLKELQFQQIMSEKTFKTYEVSYHILNKAKVYAKTKEEAAELVSNMPEEVLLDGSTLSIQHIWEPDMALDKIMSEVDEAGLYDSSYTGEDHIIESEQSSKGKGVRMSPKDLPATDEDFPLGSL